MKKFFLLIILVFNISITFSQTTKTRWVKGINPPAETDWQKVTSSLIDYKMVPWKAEYKWYDINKIRDTRDNQLCWAAVATNMLHWWLDNNAEYVKKYGKFNRSVAFHHPSKSDIFDYYKKVNLTSEQGGWADQAVNWYLNGFYSILPPKSEVEIDSRGGFFREVFRNNKLSDRMSIRRRSTFSIHLKDMFDNHRVGGVTFNVFRNTPYMHIITIWGAEFDENEQVTMLYVVDSDDENSNPQGLKKMSIIADENGYTLGVGPSGGKTTLKELQTLDLGTAMWENYFNNNSTEVLQQETDRIFIYANGNTLHIKNTELPVSVYDMRGNYIVKNSVERTLQFQQKGVYIVKVENTNIVKKIIL